MKLLSVSADAKTRKGEKRGYLTGILYLAPADSSGFNVCANASVGCKAACLNYAGRNRIFQHIQDARVRKTHALFANREQFMAELEHDIRALIRLAKRKRMTPAVRINGTSDLPWLAREMAHRFPRLQFYDYTKHPRAWERTERNYSLTFSWSGCNQDACMEALAHGINVAVPFNLKKSESLPKTFLGYRVIDGDETDLRFLDPRGVIVGLRVKSVDSARKNAGIANNFVVTIGPAPKTDRRN